MDVRAPQTRRSGELSVEQTVIVHEDLGLHARPAARLARTAGRFHAEVTLSLEGVTVDAKSILDVLCLAATRGTALLLRCQGEDAEIAARTLAALFQPTATAGEE